MRESIKVYVHTSGTPKDVRFVFFPPRPSQHPAPTPYCGIGSALSWSKRSLRHRLREVTQSGGDQIRPIGG